MPQVSLYLDQDALEIARKNARIENVSLSKYVSQVLVKSSESGWPEGYWDLFGSVDDETFVRPPDMTLDEIADRETI
jgi:hypothetical protein